MKPVWEVAGHLRAGALRPVLPDFPPEPVTLAVLYPHRELLPVKVKVFADCAVEHTRAYMARTLEGLPYGVSV
jgi:DNA-binding transcriptional LysR family regulator